MEEGAERRDEYDTKAADNAIQKNKASDGRHPDRMKVAGRRSRRRGELSIRREEGTT